MTPNPQPLSEPETPCGLNHIVLNVRDIDAAHRFWTECLGFRHVGTSRRAPDVAPDRAMRFYSGELDGKLRHHDIALVERTGLPGGRPPGAQPCRHRLSHARRLGAPDRLPHGARLALHRRVDRGVTHSIHFNDPDGNEIELVHDCRARRGKATSRPH